MRRGKIPDQLRRINGIWIPNEGESKEIQQFRIISLLNTENKIFFVILAWRFSHFSVSIGYVDTSVQKGCVAGMPGCLENTVVLTQLLREASENKGDLVVLWLNLANAYGALLHKLVEEALRRHQIPNIISNLIRDYDNDF